MLRAVSGRKERERRGISKPAPPRELLIKVREVLDKQ